DCGFGPHNPELHVACIECGRPASGVDCELGQSAICDSQNGHNIGSAGALVLS
ncbi:hypothetical protein C7212DRAFT_25753, partial [Tuber magnatum]